jgi:DNA-binding transcriptional regulator YdaS (Cro superfamily)
MPIKELADYIAAERGNGKRMADAWGCTPSYISQLASGHRKASPALAVWIEAWTSGAVTRADLRPDDYWLIWPDLTAPPESERRKGSAQCLTHLGKLACVCSCGSPVSPPLADAEAQ